MTPEEKLKDIEECKGACGDFCTQCHEMHCLGEIAEALRTVIKQRDVLAKAVYDLGHVGAGQPIEEARS